MASISVEEEHFVRMKLILTGVSPRAVRFFFDSEFAPVLLDATIKKEYNKLLDMKKNHRINQSQWNLLFPRFPDVTDSKTFDVTLMTSILRNLTPMTPPRCGFDHLPSAKETTQAADLARIKYYRNYLAHLDGIKIDTSFFNTAWTDITDAIGRLGGQQMKQECDNFKTKPLDQTNREIMIEVKQSNDKIKELKKSNAHMAEEINKIKASQRETVPWNIRARNEEKLKTWKDNDDKMFIKTKAAAHVFKCITEHSCVLITASSGVGKTATLRHVAIQMADEGYDLLMVTEPGDIVNYNNPTKKTLFVVDDLCGNFSVDQYDIRRWDQVIKSIKTILENKKNKNACSMSVTGVQR